ncbi:uncharacterized protein TANIYAMA1_1778 [Streptococcus suis]|nr:uncharacterized protein TANIYAMA1_1778 [Streptococcus suis]
MTIRLFIVVIKLFDCIGEVNSQYSQVCPKRIVRFYWGSDIDHGVTLDELKNLLITKDIKKCRKNTLYILR